MRIQMKKFGTMLISRPAGHEAYLAARAYLFSPTPPPDEDIELDFEGVHVVAPSWLDEFITGLKQTLQNPIKTLPSKNPTVTESLKAIE